MASASTTLRTAGSFRPSSLAWIPALLGIAVICGESTNTMGAAHTGVWLNQLAAALGHPHGPVALLNHLLRKSGHFTGYGILGLCFARGWYAWMRRRFAATWLSLRLRATGLGVASACVVATADEIHQIFLPTRGASPWDVLLDTCGALTFTLLAFLYMTLKRDAMVNPSAPFTTLGLSLAAFPQRLSQSGRTLRSAAQRRVRRAELIRFHACFLAKRAR